MIASSKRFVPLFTRNMAKAVAFAEKVFQEKGKEWDQNMVATALIHQIDSTQSDSLVNAWNNMNLSTQRAHATKILEGYLATRVTHAIV
jgi:hypothetical protein